jgi:hypothetical protein
MDVTRERELGVADGLRHLDQLRGHRDALARVAQRIRDDVKNVEHVSQRPTIPDPPGHLHGLARELLRAATPRIPERHEPEQAQ